jgi:hypothetical protein
MTDPQTPKGQDAPERIWAGTAYGKTVGLDWSVQRVFGQDVEYVRADLFTAAQARIAELETELHTLTTAGIIEVAVRSPSVMEYMRHWEARAEQAEAEVARLRGAVDAAVNIGLVLGAIGEDAVMIEAFRNECGPDLIARARAALSEGGE